MLSKPTLYKYRLNKIRNKEKSLYVNSNCVENEILMTSSPSPLHTLHRLILGLL